MVNLSQLESTIISICVPIKQHLAWPGRRGNHGNSANRLHLPHTFPYVLFTWELVDERTDRAAVRGTQHGNHVTQMCPMAHWATTYIQQTVHVVW